MTFDQWYANRGQQPYTTDYITAKVAWEAAVQSIAAIPQRAMFDRGVALGRKETATDCIAIIGNQYPWLVEAIQKKYL